MKVTEENIRVEYRHNPRLSDAERRARIRAVYRMILTGANHTGVKPLNRC